MLKSTRNFPSKKTKTAENRLIFFLYRRYCCVKLPKDTAMIMMAIRADNNEGERKK